MKKSGKIAAVIYNLTVEELKVIVEALNKHRNTKKLE